MSQLKQDTIDKIAATLASGELTASEISQRIGVNWMGVESCLRGMRNRGEVVRIEVKDGAKSPSRRKLTPAQVDFHALAKATGTPLHIVETVDQAVALVAA